MAVSEVPLRATYAGGEATSGAAQKRGGRMIDKVTTPRAREGARSGQQKKNTEQGTKGLLYDCKEDEGKV